MCVQCVKRREPNLTTDLARVSGAREKAPLTTNPLSHTPIHKLSVSECTYVISKHVLTKRAGEVTCKKTGKKTEKLLKVNK